MPDNFITLYNRLQSRAPALGPQLSQQLINDSWRTLQSHKPDWSWRRRHGTFAPPNLYQTGRATTNVAAGSPTTITGIGTAWTSDMIGRQIRLGGLLYPYYTIVGWISPTQLLIDQPWAGPDVVSVTYQIVQIYYPVPDDFGYWDYIISVKDAYRLIPNVSQTTLALLDPQRTNQGQTYACSFRDYTPQFGGLIGPILPVGAVGPAPISTTSTGYSYVSDATYIIQVVNGGVTGVATFQWLRSGQSVFQLPTTTSDQAQDLQDGVQIYWPAGNVVYIANDLFIINAQSNVIQSGPRFELWPGPTFNGYLYPYQYLAKEYDLTIDAPQLPPFVANRGEVLLEMALASAARYPGADADHPNIYFNLALAGMHEARAERLIWDLERNDQEVDQTNIDYQSYQMYPAPWVDGSWQQTHAPFLTR